MKAYLFSTSLVIATTLSMSTISIAQTPDGTTPANEGVCDVLKADGVTKGLYGMCVAYCEAQDISDISVPMTEDEFDELREQKGPSGKILKAYMKKKTEADPGMPCIKIEDPCPCFDDADLQTIDGYDDNGAQLSRFQCVEADYSGNSGYDKYQVTYVQEYGGINGWYSSQKFAQTFDYSYNGNEIQSCRWYDRQDNVYRSLDSSGGLTSSQHDACRQKIRDYAPVSGCTQITYP